MITSDKCDPIPVPHFKGQQQQECLDRMEPAINEISHENVVSLRAVASDPEQLHEIVKLTVYIAAYGYRGWYILNVTLS